MMRKVIRQLHRPLEIHARIDARDAIAWVPARPRSLVNDKPVKRFVAVADTAILGSPNLDLLSH
jgi:hypothetical protein